MSEDFSTFQTSLPGEVLLDKLRQWEPWSHRVDFSNGVSTADCARRTAFNKWPLRKFSAVEAVIPFARLSGGCLLDVGCNGGYNAIHVAAKYQLNVTGIDVVPRYVDASRFLADLAGVAAEFLIANAETFARTDEFDVVLHFGTLYHLPNPLLSLKQSFNNLKPGGYIALETQVYDHPDDPNLCYFMHMHNNDRSNFWALSTSVLKRYLDLIGFRNLCEMDKRVLPRLAEHMARMIMVAQKPAE